MKIALQRQVSAPVEQVFDTLAHADNYMKAVPGIVGMEYLGETRRGVGTRFRETRRMRGREASTVLEVKEYEPNKRIRLVSEAGGTVWDTVFMVRPANNGTVIAMEMEATPKNLLARLLLPIMRKPVASAIEDDMQSLKAWCEAQRDEDNPASG